MDNDGILLGEPQNGLYLKKYYAWVIYHKFYVYSVYRVLCVV